MVNAATLFFLLCSSVPAQNTAAGNLDLAAGTLAGWEGDGFALATLPGHGSARALGVSSQDQGAGGRTGLLHRTFTVPANAIAIYFSAQAVRAKGDPDDDKLDVALLAAGKRVIPKQVRTAGGWKPATGLTGGPPREYRWLVSAYVGQTLRLALVDEDDRPGRHVVCSGFEVVVRDVAGGRESVEVGAALGKGAKSTLTMRYSSTHFVTLSNAEENFTEARIRECELLYVLFYDHFRRKGFPVQPPGAKLEALIYDSPEGFEEFLGRKMSSIITGIYDSKSNRFVTYDYGQNESFLAEKSRAEREGARIDSQINRKRYLETINRQAHEVRTGANISTVMHEVAHQISFNCGLLNRQGDRPLWLVEGLACYCEPTKDGSWLGIGEPNPNRQFTLQKSVREGGKFFTVQQLVATDDWIKDKGQEQTILLGYAQSWALFRLLMEEKPQYLRRYLSLIQPRRTPDHRLTDFGQVFGPDLAALERRYRSYLQELVQRDTRPEK